MLEPWKIEATVLQTLSGSQYRRLVGAGLADPDTNAQDAAVSYFSAVFERRLWLKGAEPTHKGHELFLALCCRGAAEGWECVALNRKREVGSMACNRTSVPEGKDMWRAGSSLPSIADDFAAIALRLTQIDGAISPGNPAKNTRQRSGPLFLVVGEMNAEVAEELTIWQAICCAPLRIRKLENKATFDQLCSLVIKVLEAANRPFGELVGLGLWPPHWIDVLSLHAIREARKFVACVKRLLGPEAGGLGSLSIWRKAWEQQKVPSFGTVDEFWNSDLGSALRSPHIYRHIETKSIDEIQSEEQSECYEPQMCDGQEFEARVALLRNSRSIDDFDAMILTAIREGDAIRNLWLRLEVQGRFKQPADLAEYVEALGQRIAEAVRRFDDL